MIREHLLNPREFFTPHPIATVAVSDPRFELRMWRGPAWNCMTYWAARDCLRYGETNAAHRLLEQARTFRARWRKTSRTGGPMPDAETLKRPRKRRMHSNSSGGFPGGGDTRVGERGMSLSGGERQRVSLARAFLKDAPILILDEPTSSVDVASEGVIMEAMERLVAGRTTFMIAHRLDTLERCNIRLDFEGGGVVRSINHNEPASPVHAVHP